MSFTIPGYPGAEPGAVMHAATSVVERPAFWRHYLSGPLGTYPESEAAFDVSAAELEAMWDLLNDPERWPVFSVRLGEDSWLRIVYRNLEEDAGLDFVEERPHRPATIVAAVEGHGFTSSMTWAELLAAAALPDDQLSWAHRLLLMLPMLGAQDLPGDAEQALHRALAGIGAANRPALAARLLGALDWRTC